MPGLGALRLRLCCAAALLWWRALAVAAEPRRLTRCPPCSRPCPQVCNTYGVLRNDEALLQYGFVLPDHPPALCAIDYHDYR